jgi:hypothetical protein
MKLPVKTRILEYAILKDGPFTAEEVSETLSKEYNGEKSTKPDNIGKQLDTYCRVGFIKSADVDFDNNNKLSVKYIITEAGKTNLKYIPGHGNKYF